VKDFTIQKDFYFIDYSKNVAANLRKIKMNLSCKLVVLLIKNRIVLKPPGLLF